MDTYKNILIERAKNIAGKKKNENQLSEETISVVEFLLSPERYAFEDKYVSEVLSLKEITIIPGTPAFVMGVINLRGRIISILNLKILFKLKERGLTELNKVIVLKNEKMEFGVVVDSISGNKKLLINSLNPQPITLDNIGKEYIAGVYQDGLILLNASNLLSSKQIIFTN
ncbi:MAG: chemotaxis protein CheW [Bacteroidales bacterium]